VSKLLKRVIFFLTHNRLPFLLITTLISGSIFAQQAKKVLVINFKNTSGNIAFKYLEPTITDAIRKQLKKDYAFQTTDEKVWQKVASENFIFKPDWHTDTAAISLGLLTNQDIVLSGYLLNNGSGNGSTVNVIINIYDIQKKKKIQSLKIGIQLSGKMFDTIDKLAKTVAKAAVKVLPNKAEWKRKGLQSYMTPLLQQVSFSLGGGFFSHSQTGLSELNESSRVSPDDFNLKLNLYLQYRYFGIFKPEIFALGLIGYDFAFGTFDSEVNIPVNAISSSFKFSFGLGYRYSVNIRMKISAFAGMGFVLGSTSFNFEESNVSAINTSTFFLEENKSLTFTAPLTFLGLGFSYRLKPAVSLHSELYYMSHYFTDSYGGSLYLTLGVGYDF